MKPFNHFTMNWHNSLIVIIGLVFLSLSIFKASHSAFTHDESFTYLTYVKKSVAGIISMEQPVSANNHILNTLGMKMVDKLISPTPFNLRLPNIFGHLLFIVFSALLVSNFKNNFFKVIGFVFLNANIYIIDLFSLARGYGLSLGFLMVHWYFLIQTIDDFNNKQRFRCALVALFFAMTANFSIIYYTIALLTIFFIFEIKSIIGIKKKFTSLLLVNYKFLFLLFIISVSFFYEPIRKLIKFKQLYFGGSNNFFEDTIYSLVFNSSSLASTSESQIFNIYLIVLFTILAMLILIVIKLIKKDIISPTNFFIGVFLLIMIIQIMFFYLFNTKYLIQRTAIFLIPIICIAFINIVNDFNSNILYFLTSLICVYLFYCTLRFAPLYNSINWQYDADNENLISDLNKIYNNSDSKNKISLGIDWVFQPSLNFYRATTATGNWLDTLTKEGFENKKYSFYFVESSSLNKFEDKTQFKIVKTYSQSHNSLIKNLKFE